MTSDPTLKQLRYLCAVAEKRHFGQAAKSCFVTQSTLSAGIQELELSLGLPLVERGHKNVLLTPAGEKAVKRALDILTEVQAMKEEAAGATEPLSSSIRLGAIPTIAPFLLPDALARLRKDYPRLKLLIREDLSANLVSLLAQGDLDILLLALPYPVEGAEVHHLFDDPFVVAYPRGTAFSGRRKLRPQDLEGQEFILLEQGHCLRNHILEACQLTDSQISLGFEATSLQTIVPMVANGIGITLLPKMALDAGITKNSPGVSTLEFTGKKVKREVGLVWRKESPRVKDYQLLAEYLVNPPDERKRQR
ncbi:MAG TPA: LysR family transcriptional regulator [Porticoccaceae bacterium]|nr:LysR family transcriptional regulator [Porticoccaceae bacterium]HCO59384.1 LysR family transcriptional regulator [Porticoccaceae bacterium]